MHTAHRSVVKRTYYSWLTFEWLKGPMCINRLIIVLTVQNEMKNDIVETFNTNSAVAVQNSHFIVMEAYGSSAFPKVESTSVTLSVRWDSLPRVDEYNPSHSLTSIIRRNRTLLFSAIHLSSELHKWWGSLSMGQWNPTNLMPRWKLDTNNCEGSSA